MTVLDAARDTIAAIATPPGRGGIGIVRVSGPRVGAIAAALLAKRLAPRYATYAAFRDHRGEAIDRGMALYFPAPRSFTGEDALELHGHGGTVVLAMVLARVLALGARPARPGEFSERAFFNDKLDLAQAEAVADLIDSNTEQAARSAQRSLQGALSGRVEALREALIDLRAYIEAGLDFPDEEIDLLADSDVASRLAALRRRLADVQATARQGALLREGMTLVIGGPPNVGKSSLLNRLAGREAAIVTEVAGTTRDILREDIQIDGLPLKVIDTAGLRDSTEPIEREGVRRAWAEIEHADLLALVVDDRVRTRAPEDAIGASLPTRLPVLRVCNKIDLTGASPGIRSDASVGVSALTGAGLDALREALETHMGYRADGEGVFMARQRHLSALATAADALERAAAELEASRAGELVAEELRAAQDALGEITGAFTSEDLLGKIFSSFCIGK